MYVNLNAAFHFRYRYVPAAYRGLFSPFLSHAFLLFPYVPFSVYPARAWHLHAALSRRKNFFKKESKLPQNPGTSFFEKILSDPAERGNLDRAACRCRGKRGYTAKGTYGEQKKNEEKGGEKSIAGVPAQLNAKEQLPLRGRAGRCRPEAERGQGRRERAGPEPDGKNRTGAGKLEGMGRGRMGAGENGAEVPGKAGRGPGRGKDRAGPRRGKRMPGQSIQAYEKKIC